MSDLIYIESMLNPCTNRVNDGEICKMVISISCMSKTKVHTCRLTSSIWSIRVLAFGKGVRRLQLSASSNVRLAQNGLAASRHVVTHFGESVNIIGHRLEYIDCILAYPRDTEEAVEVGGPDRHGAQARRPQAGGRSPSLFV